MASQGQQEPVMEDVLASIKKILSEDDDNSEKKANEDGAEVSTSLNLEQVDTKKEGLSHDEASDAVDEPSDAVDEPSDAPNLSDIEGNGSGTLEENSLNELEGAKKSQENDLSQEDGDEVGQEIADSINSVDDTLTKIEDTSSGNYLEDTPVFPGKGEFKVTGKESLVAEKVKDMSGKHFSDLAKVVAEERSISLGNHGLSLEELVREILNPILKDWLDKNLPHMVERIVKQEIELIVNRSERLDE